MHSKITKIYCQMFLLGLAFDIFIMLRKKEWKNAEDCNHYMANNLVVFLFFKILLLFCALWILGCAIFPILFGQTYILKLEI